MRFAILLSLVIVAMSCNKEQPKKTTTTDNTSGEVSTKPPVKKPAKISVETGLPTKILDCKKDEDCGTHSRYLTSDGRCCHSCNGLIGAKIWITAVEKLCSSRESEGCPKKKCIAPPTTKCFNNKCVDAKLVKANSQSKRVTNPYMCAKNEDCVKTVLHGALNANWYKQNKTRLLQGENGCASKMTGKPQCIKTLCTAFGRDGKKSDYCTSKKLHYSKVEAPYICDKNSDCIKTCGQGAVNGKWYKKNKSRLLNCKDGCSSQKTGDPKCEYGSCVSYTYKGKRDGFCTRRKFKILKK